MEELPLVEQYRKELYRIGWRIQYRARVISNREIVKEEREFYTTSFTDGVDNELYIEDLINSLPSTTGKKIIYELYINDKTEAQVARELNMTQQAVSKWKKKMLKHLSQTPSLTSSSI